ncbi:L-lysine 6-transaminase [Melioribacter sp. Ez-97]|uniref:L-lysine 6-transaminase n=1 Tax=Melioribacter sp. Ez-97 TaxID=3423434 RepID=UPI003EDA9D3B
MITKENALEFLRRYMLIDGFDILLDLSESKGIRIVDERNGNEFLDFYSFFASSPVGMNHPKLFDKEFLKELQRAALTKPSNSDIYTLEMAKFVEAFSKYALPPDFKHLFFIDGGALAVENALKAAFDWKVKKNFQKGYKEEKGSQVIHFRNAFHGRTGYTLSLTNTDPNKTAYFPKFNWPRIPNPKIISPIEENLDKIIKAEAEAVDQIYTAIKNNPDDIAALIIEPVQGEGGDNFFRKEFFEKLREITFENDIMLIFDEVQTGIGLTGKMWAFEHYVQPDMISFGKKTQVCGFMSTGRIDEVEDNVFRKSSRINSTWGGNLVDMARSRKYLEIIAQENLVENAKETGKYLLDNLKMLETKFPNLVSQARGLGLMCSFDLPDPEIRKKFLAKLFEKRMLMLGCGANSVRFRPPLIVTKNDIDAGIKIIQETLASL